MYSTNYHDTFIEVADDCPVTAAEVPRPKGSEKSVAVIQYEIIQNAPYRHTSDDVLFQTHLEKKGIHLENAAAERLAFFSKGQPCFRASPLTRRYGWGVHFDGEGRMALYPVESKKYEKLADDKNLRQIKAMRSNRSAKQTQAK